MTMHLTVCQEHYGHTLRLNGIGLQQPKHPNLIDDIQYVWIVYRNEGRRQCICNPLRFLEIG